MQAIPDINALELALTVLLLPLGITLPPITLGLGLIGFFAL